jgi:hypothetical protein
MIKEAIPGQKLIGEYIVKGLADLGTKGPMTEAIGGAAKKLMTSGNLGFGEAAKKGIQYLSKFKGPHQLMDPKALESAAGIVAPVEKGLKSKARNFFEIAKPEPVGAITNIPKQKGLAKVTGGFLHGVGNQAANLNAILFGGHGMQSKTMLGRIPEFLKKEVVSSQYRVGATVGDKSLIYKRGPIGKVMFPLISTGAGMGAIGAAMKKNEDNSPVTVGQRVGTGVSESLKWGIAAPAIIGKYMAYDLPKAGVDIFKQVKQNKQLNKE